MLSSQTTYAETVEHFLRICPGWKVLLDGWRSDPRYRSEVVPFVESTVVSALYRLTPNVVETVGRHSVHALGQVQRSVAESVQAIVDWNPDFALQHSLHLALEKRGLLTYQAFRVFCDEDPQARHMLLEPAQRMVENLVSTGEAKLEAARAAMRWRVGLAYYAFLKEVYVIATLREAGVDARYHPIADALFRVDCWVGEVAFNVFVGNPKFRSGEEGRKPRPGCTALRVVTLDLPTRHVFGSVHLPERDDIIAAWKSAWPGP